MVSTDPVFAQLGTDGKAMLTDMDENGIYLDAISASRYEDIIVTRTADADIYDLASLGAAKCEELAKQLMNDEQSQKAGIVNTGYTLYSHPQAQFVVIDSRQQTARGMMVYGRQYITVVNGDMINVMLHSYGTELTGDQKAMLQSVIDKLTFTKITKKPFPWASILVPTGIGAGAIVVFCCTFAFVKVRKQKRARIQ